MRTILAALRRFFAAEQSKADPTQAFTPRDWADLPVHHPLTECKTAR